MSTKILRIEDAFVRVTVIKSHYVNDLTTIVGWIYFFAWSLSFYPQIYLNFKRKSVTGLKFDFLLLNVIGFLAYSMYNLFMYFDPNVQIEYQHEHPRSPIPVLLNDVIFALHALAACIITVLQCFLYEMYFNFQRKSTVGWSIGNVLLDFTGGSMDILQMVLQCMNNNDWVAFIGNPVKFGLGLVSISFDIIFIIQHYVLYKGVEVVHAEYEGVQNPDALQSSPTTNHRNISSSHESILEDVPI
ncbi:Lysosomal Cystine Transporter [Dictyocaulus viviparus]|uniref:Lysosomal Cystine Transporter n=1 Tax=Dictyocaulus viviparus TaxID=29172 RepID=A0A0D8XL21_DICVI|nr:Lysosomal Cystine Transporter [Dictyocaulus viviparus]